MKNLEPKTSSEFIIHFHQVAKITEEFTENSLTGLCYHIFEASKTWGDPVKVVYPNGTEYYWGEKGMWLAHQYAAEGRITEEQFLTWLKEYNADATVMAQRDVNSLAEIVTGWKAEIKQAEQKTQEAIAGYSNAFEMYMKARTHLFTLNQEAK
ncbi:MAG: hypothetical protein WCX31_04505 [Salinivirgaceae bacterium]